MSDQPHDPDGPTAPVEESSAPAYSDGSPDDDWSKTRVSLLERLKDRRNPEAWKMFVDRYGPRFNQWARAWFQPNEAEDVAQEVFLKLVSAMESFVYRPEKGKFRSFLKTTTTRVMIDLARKRRDKQTQDALVREEARVDLEQRLADEYDLERFELAEERVRLRRIKEPYRWKVYVEVDKNGSSPKDVARKLGIPVARVFSASYEVKQMIKEELAKIGDPD